MCGLRSSPLLCLVVLFASVLQYEWAEAVVPVDGAAKVTEIKRSQSPVTTSTGDDAVANADTVMADNNIRISDSQIVLAAQDKKAVIKAIADAVLAKQVGVSTTSDSDDSDSADFDDKDKNKSKTGTVMKKKTARVIPMPVTFPISRDAFLYYVSDPKDASKSFVRLGWRYSLSDWKLYRALIAPSACEVKRVIGDYYYC